LGLTIASRSATSLASRPGGKLVGHSGLNLKIKTSGQSARIGRTSKAGPDTLRWAAVEASQQPGARATPGTSSTPTSSAAMARPTRPRPPSVRKILIASGHMLSRNEPFKPSAQCLWFDDGRKVCLSTISYLRAVGHTVLAGRPDSRKPAVSVDRSCLPGATVSHRLPGVLPEG
jgi:hypothetical protein